MRNCEIGHTSPHFSEYDDKKTSPSCDAANRNILAVAVADILYDGKDKAQISDVVNFLHILIALAKSY